MKILVVDNDPSQRVVAQRMIEHANHEAVVTSCMDDALWATSDGNIEGIITDFLFNPLSLRTQNPLYRIYQENPPPCGVAMIIAAIQLEIPIAICTDSHRHSPEYSWFNEMFMTHFALQSPEQRKKSYPKPVLFDWIEQKNWSRAIACVVSRAQP